MYTVYLDHIHPHSPKSSESLTPRAGLAVFRNLRTVGPLLIGMQVALSG